MRQHSSWRPCLVRLVSGRARVLVRRDADLVGCLLASEYLRRPAPRTRYASQFGHVLRILEIYHTVESVLGVSSRRASAAIAF